MHHGHTGVHDLDLLCLLMTKDVQTGKFHCCNHWANQIEEHIPPLSSPLVFLIYILKFHLSVFQRSLQNLFGAHLAQGHQYLNCLYSTTTSKPSDHDKVIPDFFRSNFFRTGMFDIITPNQIISRPSLSWS